MGFTKEISRWLPGSIRETKKINTIIVFVDIVHRHVFYLNSQRFGDWILYPSSGGIYSVGPKR
jgi:hypothetical protein